MLESRTPLVTVDRQRRPARPGRASRAASAPTALTALVALGLLCLAPAAARAAELAVTGGRGEPGETVPVVFSLAGDAAGAAVTADLDIEFPIDQVEFLAPVTENCRIAERLATTHEIGGQLVMPGVLRIAIFGRALQIAPLGDGALASCDFRILPGATATSAPLVIDFGQTSNASGTNLFPRKIDGAITIGAAEVCAVDCDGDGSVSISELITAVNISLGSLEVSECPAADVDGDGQVEIPELISGVLASLGACKAA